MDVPAAGGGVRRAKTTLFARRCEGRDRMSDPELFEDTSQQLRDIGTADLAHEILGRRDELRSRLGLDAELPERAVQTRHVGERPGNRAERLRLVEILLRARD